MVKLEFSIELNYKINDDKSDFIFNIHAANTPKQSIISEKLELSQDVETRIHVDSSTGSRFAHLSAGKGDLKVKYNCLLNINPTLENPNHIRESSILNLPGHVLKYIYPSRYCQSDRLHKFAFREFGHIPMGYNRVLKIKEWVINHVTFTPSTSNWNTSALDTLVDRVGVCRDFTHLMIALCRAVNIPARFTTGIDYGADPIWGPTDFHAYVEVFLDGRWYIFNPSNIGIPMGFVRMGVGRDAADVSFATIFGAVKASVPLVDIKAFSDYNNILPYECNEAISTDDESVQCFS